MKNTKKCPKCASGDIMLVVDPGLTGGAGNIIYTGLTRFSAVPVERYVCCSCGYSEEWIDRADIFALKKAHGK